MDEEGPESPRREQTILKRKSCNILTQVTPEDYRSTTVVSPMTDEISREMPEPQHFSYRLRPPTDLQSNISSASGDEILRTVFGRGVTTLSSSD